MSRPRVALLESRMSGELAELVRRHGGEPRVAPALRETPLDASCAVAGLIDALVGNEVDVMVFLTGVGAAGLFREAERIGRLTELVERLRGTTNVCRGQKPWQPLKRHAVPISITVPKPYTTADVLTTLAELRLAGRGVALLHYGERSTVLAEALERWQARVRELCLYEWRLPEDTGPLEMLVEEAIAGELDAVMFTSQVQVRHLFQIAAARGNAEALRKALVRHTTVAAVGPTCAAALEAAGVTPHVVPANPKMGPMAIALMEHLKALGASA